MGHRGVDEIGLEGRSREALKLGRQAVWLRETISEADAIGSAIQPSEVETAAERFVRFQPVFAELFAAQGWDGHVRSALLDGPPGTGWLVKGDHDLPVTGSIKARGGVHALLAIVERIADEARLPLNKLCTASGRLMLSCHSIVVASTGNLGYSIGIFARAFGLQAEIHMSADARGWKKDRLRAIGARVVEHACDYSETLVRARMAAAKVGCWLVDDECSRDLLTGYAVASAEVIEQLDARGVIVDARRPLVAYLPCGVGGAPGGIAYGLKRRFGRNVVTVFVEPVAAPCMLAALAFGGRRPVSVYDYGCDNRTIADGLAVPLASQLVLDAVGDAIDAAIAVPDAAMTYWAARMWDASRLRLEPSAAAAFAAHEPLLEAVAQRSGWLPLDEATHLFWATGGSKLPDDEFAQLIEAGR